MAEKQLLPSIESAFGQINDIIKERDELQAEVARLTHELTAAEARFVAIEGVLARTTADKDYYLRYSTELFHQLQNCADVIHTALNKAAQVANEGRSPEDERQLRKIANRFAPQKVRSE